MTERWMPEFDASLFCFRWLLCMCLLVSNPRGAGKQKKSSSSCKSSRSKGSCEMIGWVAGRVNAYHKHPRKYAMQWQGSEYKNLCASIGTYSQDGNEHACKQRFFESQKMSIYTRWKWLGCTVSFHVHMVDSSWPPSLDTVSADPRVAKLRRTAAEKRDLPFPIALLHNQGIDHPLPHWSGTLPWCFHPLEYSPYIRTASFVTLDKKSEKIQRRKRETYPWSDEWERNWNGFKSE